MSKRQYTPLWKYIGILAQTVLTVVFVMSIVLLDALIDRNMLDTGDLWNANFLESDCYNELFLEKTDELISYMQLRGKFETDGIYNPNKVVNTLRYSADFTVASGAEDTDRRSMHEAIQLKMSNYRMGDLISWAKEGYTSTNGRLEELYLPVGGVGIAEALEMGLITKEQEEHLYSALEQTLSVIGDEARVYKKALNEFATEETNLQYIYGERGSVRYSNRETLPEDILAYAREQGSYFYYDSMELKLRTNVSGMENYFYRTLDRRISRLGNQVLFVVAVDTGFGQEDAFSRTKAEYDILHPWIMIGIVALVVSLFCGVIVLVYLTMAAGHGGADELIHLNFFDRIKTELFFVAFVIIMYALILTTLTISQENWGISGMLVMAGTGAFLYDAVILLFYLSVIRRVKAGVLWENSLLWWFVKNIRRTMRTGKKLLWILLQYGAKLFFLLLFTYGSFVKRNVPAIVGLLIWIGIEMIFYLRDMVGQQEIMRGIKKITKGDLTYKLPLDNLHGDNLELAKAVNSIGDGLRRAVDESTKNERMKADLITNVSHDIKTPLTSIINYVNLLKMEPIADKRTKDYINILDEKSQRLKQLTEDLVEASRISSGNIVLQMSEINFVELIYQTGGEFNEMFEEKDLTTITRLPKEAAIIMADGRRIWRVVENLYNNVAKYAMAHTRVYVTMEKMEHEVTFSIKNISEQPLAVDSSELTERFIRGDEARTTEGSGLGLSIAQNLTTLMGGQFGIELDGDLFTVIITFPLKEVGNAMT